MKRKQPRSIWRVTAALTLFLVGASALTAGYSLITEPSGAGLGLQPDYLRFSPFTNFRIPGIFLFLFNGLLNFVAIAFGLSGSRHYPAMVFVQGIVLIGWILIQVLFVRDFNALHATCILAGCALAAAGRKLQAAPVDGNRVLPGRSRNFGRYRMQRQGPQRRKAPGSGNDGIRY